MVVVSDGSTIGTPRGQGWSATCILSLVSNVYIVDTRESRLPKGGVGMDTATEAALRQLYIKHYQPLTRLAKMLGSDDAEDAVCESFLRLTKNYGRIRNDQVASG